MKRRRDPDEIASLNMVGEGCPYFDKEAETEQKTNDNDT